MNPTGSSLERAEKCPRSFQIELQVGNTSAASIRGTDNHAEMESSIKSGDLSALKPRTQEFVRTFGVIKAVEAGYAINVDTGAVRSIKSRGEGGYAGLSEGDIALTVDLVAERDGETWVVDWKSSGRVTPAKDNLQLLAGAYATKATKVAIHYLDNGETDQADVHEMDRDAFLVRAKDIVRKIREPNAALHEGSWCTYCPAKFGCPAKASYIKHALAIAPSEILSAERAGEIWGEIKRAKGVIETMEDAIKLMSKDVDIPLPNGRVLRQVPVTSQRTDLKSVEADYAARGVEIPKYSYTHYTTKEVKP